MKKNVIVLLLLCSGVLTAQENFLNFGIKAGLNYGDNGEIELRDVVDTSEDIVRKDASNRTGYHFGVFLRANITENFYLKPELQYTLNQSSYSLEGQKLEYDVKKIDMPILAGVSVLGPIHIFGGPSLQYLLENDVERIRLGDVKNDFTLGMQFGIGLQIKRFNADIRYERGLSENQADALEQNFGVRRVDSRPNQFIVSVALDF